MYIKKSLLFIPLFVCVLLCSLLPVSAFCSDDSPQQMNGVEISPQKSSKDEVKKAAEVKVAEKVEVGHEPLAPPNAENDRKVAVKAELDRLTASIQEEERKVAAERKEQERLAALKVKEAKAAAAKAEEDRLLQLKVEKERATAATEAARLAALKTEQERVARAEQERIARVEQERIAKAEQERAARAEQERIAKAEQVQRTNPAVKRYFKYVDRNGISSWLESAGSIPPEPPVYYNYKDENGLIFWVDSVSKIPEEYRDSGVAEKAQDIKVKLTKVSAKKSTKKSKHAVKGRKSKKKHRPATKGMVPPIKV